MKLEPYTESVPRSRRQRAGILDTAVFDGDRAAADAGLDGALVDHGDAAVRPAGLGAIADVSSLPLDGNPGADSQRAA